MSSANVADFEFRIFEELQYYLEDLPDYGDDIDIHHQTSSSIPLTGYSDITISKAADIFPDELDQIESIEQWYPNKIFQVPVIEIEIKHRGNTPAGRRLLNEIELGTPSGNYDLPERYLVINEGGIQASAQDEFEDNDYVIVTSGEKKEIRGNVCHNILTHELAGFQPLPENHREVEEIFASIESKVFHYNEVKALYEDQRTGPLIVLLSVFFESHCSELLDVHLKKHSPDSDESTFLSGRERFSKLLDMCEYYNIFDGIEYDAEPIHVMKLCYNARNKYAHSLSRYHSSETTELERQNKIEDAIKLYETLVGVEESML
jgi:hypothetical protein